MTPQIRAEIASLREQLTQLELARARHAQTMARALAAEFYNESDVNEAQFEMQRVERRLARTTERLAALEAQLPTPEQTASAEQSSRELSRCAQEASGRAVAAFPRFLESLQVSEQHARELIGVRREAAIAIARLTDLVRQFDLDLRVPPVPVTSQSDSELATHLAMVLEAVAAGSEPSDTVELYLRAARAERTSELEQAVMEGNKS